MFRGFAFFAKFCKTNAKNQKVKIALNVEKTSKNPIVKVASNAENDRRINKHLFGEKPTRRHVKK